MTTQMNDLVQLINQPAQTNVQPMNRLVQRFPQLFGLSSSLTPITPAPAPVRSTPQIPRAQAPVNPMQTLAAMKARNGGAPPQRTQTQLRLAELLGM